MTRRRPRRSATSVRCASHASSSPLPCERSTACGVVAPSASAVVSSASGASRRSPRPNHPYRPVASSVVDFELSDELAELQATVRKLAQERVAPRAREIDETEKYPDDLFALFVDTGLTGLCIPEEYGGAGAGILGLTIAIEGVAKDSNAAAPMLPLTRPPTRPPMIARAPAHKQPQLPPAAT